MPSESVLKKKQQIVTELSDKLKKATSGILIDYKGINVEQDTNLRSQFRKAGVEYSVVKNTLTRFAAKEAGLEGIIEVLEGTTSLALSNDDPIAPAKIFAEFVKKNKLGLSVKAGFVDGKVLSSEQVQSLAELPPKKVLISMVLCGLNSPISGLANALNGTIRGLAIALGGVLEKKQAAGE